MANKFGEALKLIEQHPATYTAYTEYLDSRLDEGEFPFRITIEDVMSSLAVFKTWKNLTLVTEYHLQQYNTASAEYKTRYRYVPYIKGGFGDYIEIHLTEKQSRMADEMLKRISSKNV
jgi:hypothetical protein